MKTFRKVDIEKRKKHYHIKLLSGFGNRLVHDYDNVSYNFFIEILENDLPKFKDLILKILTQ